MGSALEFERMVSFVGDKKIKPFVSKVITGKLSDFEKWEEAFEELKGGSRVGKVVFEVQEEAREKTGVVGAKL